MASSTPPPAAAAAATGATPPTVADISYLDQYSAQQLDVDLMSEVEGFSIDQLMELAGLSCASALQAEYHLLGYPRIIVFVGPGNNGGDGLVMARHLTHFGYKVSICQVKPLQPTDKALFHGLVAQCRSLGMEFMSVSDVLEGGALKERWDVAVDALFGFSFKGTPRPPYDAIIKALSPCSNPPLVVSIDIPSGWDVEQGPINIEQEEQGGGYSIQPDMLISLTTPKLAAKHFTGRFHYLGGRFVPPSIARKYNLVLPPYPAASQCVRLDGGVLSSVADMRVSYSPQGSALDESVVQSNPMNQFSAWFLEAAACPGLEEPNAMALATCSSNGAPSVRMVLLKGFDSRGIVFYTNYDSRKGMELQTNKAAAATFWWEAVQRSVRFEGNVTQLSAAESDAYWNSRPLGHQLGAIVSQQSSVLSGGRAELEGRAAAIEAEYAGKEGSLPRPDHWGGFLLQPSVVEFWQGRPSRLHDRLRYRRREENEDDWVIERLAP